MKEVSNEVWEIARDLYDDADFNINRYGEVENFGVMPYEDYNGYYNDCTEADFEEAKKYLEELLDGVKYYEGKLVLSDNETANDIDYQAMTPPKPNEVDDFWAVYEMIYSQALENFEQETGVEIYGLGRSGKHICVDDTFVNLTHLEELKNLQQKWEGWLKDEIVKHYTDTEEEVTESLNKGEKKARCLSCGVDVIYTNRDVMHDIDGDYIECPNCHATFDVDYDAIEPLLNKKTEAEDMSKVKDDVKDAVEKSDSTEQEKDQVKGSIDVLKTDEESAIDGYEEFNKETAKVVDKELSDEIDNQMQEIVDDEKEHIEKLDTIKSALGESKKITEEFWEDGKMYNYKGIDIQQTISDRGTKLYSILNNQKPFSIPDFRSLKDAKKYIDDNNLRSYKEKQEELFNNSINLNVDAGDIASGNNLDLGGLGALAGLMASEETKKSDDKLEEATTGDVIRENLNTGVLRIIDVDMYSLNDEIPERATQEGLDEIIQDIAPKYLKEVIQEVLPSVEIYATGVYHPRQYNFSGDELEFDLVANKEEYEALKEKVTSDENFNAYLRNNYKSYDGFISYMADDISEFETQDTWKQLVQVIMFALGDEDNFGPIRNEYLDEFLDRVHTEFGWDDEEDDLEESKKEELFNNDINSSANTEDKLSNLNESKNYKVELTSDGYGAISNTSGREETIYLTAENSDEAMNKGLDIAEKEGLDNCIVDEIKEPVVFDIRHIVEHGDDIFDKTDYCHIKANTKEDAINYYETKIKGRPTIDYDGNYTKESYGRLISCEISDYPFRKDYEYIVTESKNEEKEESESNKKEELFNNTLDVNVNANDIGSNNTLDLGGLGDLMGMTEAKVIEAKNKEVNN